VRDGWVVSRPRGDRGAREELEAIERQVAEELFSKSTMLDGSLEDQLMSIQREAKTLEDDSPIDDLFASSDLDLFGPALDDLAAGLFAPTTSSSSDDDDAVAAASDEEAFSTTTTTSSVGAPVEEEEEEEEEAAEDVSRRRRRRRTTKRKAKKTKAVVSEEEAAASESPQADEPDDALLARLRQTNRTTVPRNPMDMMFDAKLLEHSEELSLGRISRALYRCEIARDALLDLCSWEPSSFREQTKRKKAFSHPIPQDLDDEVIERLTLLEIASASHVGENAAPDDADVASEEERKKTASQRRRVKNKMHHMDAEAVAAREKLQETPSFRRAWAEACGFDSFDPLAEKIRKGRQARQALVAANMRLVFVLAKRHEGRGVAFSDLVQEGAVGLMCAAVKFDPGRGYKFSTYAFHWIRQAMLRSLACNSRLIRLPMYVHDEVVRLHRSKTAFLSDHAREPTESELADSLAVPPAKVRKLLEAAQRAVPLSVDDAAVALHSGGGFSAPTGAASTLGSSSSGTAGYSSSTLTAQGVTFSSDAGPALNSRGTGGKFKHRGYSPLNEFDDANGALYFSHSAKKVSRSMRNNGRTKASQGGDYLSVGDTVVSGEPDAEKAVDFSLMLAAIRKVLHQHLDDDERFVIKRRFGLDDGQRHTQAQIAAQKNKPRAWVKATEATALRKLRHPHAQMLLRHYNEQKEDLFRAGTPSLFDDHPFLWSGDSSSDEDPRLVSRKQQQHEPPTTTTTTNHQVP